MCDREMDKMSATTAALTICHKNDAQISIIADSCGSLYGLPRRRLFLPRDRGG